MFSNTIAALAEISDTGSAYRIAAFDAALAALCEQANEVFAEVRKAQPNSELWEELMAEYMGQLMIIHDYIGYIGEELFGWGIAALIRTELNGRGIL